MVDGESANETHLAHVGGKLIDLLPPCTPNVGGNGGRSEFVLLDVHPSHPIPFSLEFFNQACPAKSPTAGSGKPKP